MKTHIFSGTKTRHPRTGVQDDLVLVTKLSSLFFFGREWGLNCSFGSGDRGIM